MLVFACALYLSIFFIIWAMSSPVAKYFIKPILTSHQLALSEQTTIRFNPFLSELSVRNLSLVSTKKQSSTPTLSVKKFTVRISLHELLFDTVHITKFILSEANLVVSRNKNTLLIAGVEIPTDDSTNIEQENPPLTFFYQLLIPHFQLEQINIEVTDEAITQIDNSHLLTIEKLTVKDLLATPEEQQASIQLQALVDNAMLTVTGDATFNQGKGKINSTTSLTQYPIAKLQQYMSELSVRSGKLSIESEQTLTVVGNVMDITIHKAQINNSDLAIDVNEQQVTLTDYHQHLANLKFTLTDNELSNLHGNSSIRVANANVYHQNVNKQLLGFDSLAIEGIKIGFEQTPHINIANIAMNNVITSKLGDPNKHFEQQLPPIIRLKHISLHEIDINEQNLSINHLTLDKLQSHIHIGKDKLIQNLISLPEKTNTHKATKSPQASPKDSGYIVSLKHVNLVNDNTITLTDNSMEPTVQRIVKIDKFEIGAITNDPTNQKPSPFSIAGRTNKYASFALKGTLHPFAATPRYHIEGDLKELSLLSLSPYVKAALELEINTGQLNSNVNLSVTGEQLEGEIGLQLHGFETALVDSHQAGSLINQGALPLNMALGMLKDNDGSVALDIPVSGSMADPQFGLYSILSLITQKAIMAATQDYLIKTFVPYANIVSVAISAGKFALKIRFDDLIYQVKQIEPSPLQTQYLQQFIALMQDKKDTRVTICAISTPEDIDRKPGTKISNKEDINRLKEIAVQREHRFKNYIMTQGKIESARLLLCAPKIDTSTSAKPRITLSV